jgi:hypothetical protein
MKKGPSTAAVLIYTEEDFQELRSECDKKIAKLKKACEL